MPCPDCDAGTCPHANACADLDATRADCDAGTCPATEYANANCPPFDPDAGATAVTHSGGGRIVDISNPGGRSPFFERLPSAQRLWPDGIADELKRRDGGADTGCGQLCRYANDPDTSCPHDPAG
jgi:hypothetical protein